LASDGMDNRASRDATARSTFPGSASAESPPARTREYATSHTIAIKITTVIRTSCRNRMSYGMQVNGREGADERLRRSIAAASLSLQAASVRHTIRGLARIKEDAWPQHVIRFRKASTR
jgi:hypothetical protein